MHVKKANCGASVKSSQKPKKMNMGGVVPGRGGSFKGTK